MKKALLFKKGEGMKKLSGVLTLVCFWIAGPGTGLAQGPSAQAYDQAGNQLYSAQNYDQAILYYKAAVQLDPNNWPAYQGLGNCDYAKGDKPGALANYNHALSLNPNNALLSQFV